MPHIAILAASVREGRKSNRVAHFFHRYITENRKPATAEVVDLQQYQFPLFDERLSHQHHPDERVLEFAGKIKHADGVIIVTPEYNGGYPAALKNVIDLLYPEWYKKPTGISTVSDGIFGGTQVLISLQFTLWKMRAWTIPAMFPVPEVEKNFSPDGELLHQGLGKRAAAFVDELFWCVEARSRMDS